MTDLLMTPHFAITLTLVVYLAGLWLYRLSNGSSLFQPVVVGIVGVIAVLTVLDMDYETYFGNAAIIHFLLGTATVALALPLYRNLSLIRANLGALLITLAISGIVAAGLAVGILWLTGADGELLRSMATKSITTPFAISVSEQIGGYPALAATFVIVTGILVAAFGSPILNLMGVTHPAARGCAMGMIGHGVGTARAFEMGARTGAFAALSMSLMGLYTALGLGVLLS